MITFDIKDFVNTKVQSRHSRQQNSQHVQTNKTFCYTTFKRNCTVPVKVIKSFMFAKTVLTKSIKTLLIPYEVKSLKTCDFKIVSYYSIHVYS